MTTLCLFNYKILCLLTLMFMCESKFKYTKKVVCEKCISKTHMLNTKVQKSKVETTSNLTFKSSWLSLTKKTKYFIYFRHHAFLKIYLNVYTSRNFVLYNKKRMNGYPK